MRAARSRGGHRGGAAIERDARAHGLITRAAMTPRTVATCSPPSRSSPRPPARSPQGAAPAGRGRARDPLPALPPRERPHRDPPRGSHDADRRRSRPVRRRLEEREAGPHRLRAPLRAPHVPGHASTCRRARRIGSSTPRAAARTARPPGRHPVLGAGAVERARADALRRVRPDGLPPARRSPGEARQPARRRPERAARELRDAALRARVREDPRRTSGAPSSRIHWMPIGSHEDLEAATLEDVREFFQRWYGPENAVLAIAGDIDPPRRRARSSRSGSARSPASRPRGPRPRRRRSAARSGSRWRTGAAPAPLHRVADAEALRAGETPRSTSPGRSSPDGKSARLVKRLVMDERIAQGVSAGQMTAGARLDVPRGRDAEAGRLARAAREGDRRGARAARRGAAEHGGAAAREERDRGRRDLRPRAGGRLRRPRRHLAEYYLRPGIPASSPRPRALPRAHPRGRLRRHPPLPAQGRASSSRTPSRGAPEAPARAAPAPARPAAPGAPPRRRPSPRPPRRPRPRTELPDDPPESSSSLAAALACAGQRAAGPRAGAPLPRRSPRRPRQAGPGPLPGPEIGPARARAADPAPLRARERPQGAARRVPPAAGRRGEPARRRRRRATPATLPGLASFTAAMLTEGTKTRCAIELSDETTSSARRSAPRRARTRRRSASAVLASTSPSSSSSSRTSR